MSCSNLPHLIEYDKYHGNWEKYTYDLKSIFENNKSDLIFENKPVNFGKDSFWHITQTEDKQNNARFPDFKRCERISYFKFLILGNYCLNCTDYKIWKQLRTDKNKTRTYIWCPKAEYVVVLEETKNSVIFITAYYVNENTKRNFFKAYAEYKTKTPNIN